jgi:hypothetical protein
MATMLNNPTGALDTWARTQRPMKLKKMTTKTRQKIAAIAMPAQITREAGFPIGRQLYLEMHVRPHESSGNAKIA